MVLWQGSKRRLQPVKLSTSTVASPASLTGQLNGCTLAVVLLPAPLELIGLGWRAMSSRVILGCYRLLAAGATVEARTTSNSR